MRTNRARTHPVLATIHMCRAVARAPEYGANKQSKLRQPFPAQGRHLMVTAQVIFANQNRPSLPQCQCPAAPTLARNWLRITSLADPCTLTPLESNPYEKPGGGGYLVRHPSARRGDSFTPILPISTLLQLPLFLASSKPPNLQFLCFDNVATVPGGRGALLAL